MRSAAVAIAEERVFALARIQLIKGSDALGSVFQRLGEGDNAGNGHGIGCLVPGHPFAVGVQGVDVILFGFIGAAERQSGRCVLRAGNAVYCFVINAVGLFRVRAAESAEIPLGQFIVCKIRQLTVCLSAKSAVRLSAAEIAAHAASAAHTAAETAGG